MNVYTIVGEQTVLCEKEIERILSHHHIQTFDAITYDMKEQPVSDAIFDLKTVPFLSSKKAIIIKHPLFLTATTQKSDALHDVSVFQDYLEHQTSENILIIYAPYEKLDERKKIVKLLKKVSKVITFEVFNHQSLIRWLKQKLDGLNITYDENALTTMLLRTHEKIDLLAVELEKIELYYLEEENRHLTTEIVELLVPRELEDNVFQLTEAILNQKICDAYQVYKDLVAQNEEPFKILILLANQFRLMSQLLKLSKQGYREHDMAKTLNVHPYRVKKVLQQSYRFKEQSLEFYLMRLAETDYKIKTGELNKELGLEVFILSI